MDPKQLILLAVRASVLLLVFALGLRATAAEATYVLRRPSVFARALLAASFDFRRPVELALLAMAVSPVPPVLPSRQFALGGRPSYVYGLLIAMSLAAVLLVPLSVGTLGWVFHRTAHIDASVMVRLVGVTVLVPLLAGRPVHPSRPGWPSAWGPRCRSWATCS